MDSRTILIVGRTEHAVEALESSYARALAQLGFEVHRWDPMEALYRNVRLDRLGRLFSTFVHVEPWLRKANLELLARVDELRPALVLVIATSGVRAGTLAQIRVRAPETLIYCVYPDSPHNLDNDRIHCLPFFDRVTVSSPAWASAFEHLGAERVHYLPFAADTALHTPAQVEQNAEGRHDLAFVGTWRPEREALLEQLSDFDLVIWGGAYWKKRTQPGSRLRRAWAGRPAFGVEFAQVCANSRIMLNVMDAATWPGPNMRTFEHAACGAFTLVTRSPATLELFVEGETIASFETPEEARSKIRYYLEHEDLREKIAQASYRFVVEGDHTYLDRAKQLIEWMSQDAR